MDMYRYVCGHVQIHLWTCTDTFVNLCSMFALLTCSCLVFVDNQFWYTAWVTALRANLTWWAEPFAGACVFPNTGPRCYLNMRVESPIGVVNIHDFLTFIDSPCLLRVYDIISGDLRSVTLARVLFC